jgi:hypothetical protein
MYLSIIVLQGLLSWSFKLSGWEDLVDLALTISKLLTVQPGCTEAE